MNEIILNVLTVVVTINIMLITPLFILGLKDWGYPHGLIR